MSALAVDGDAVARVMVRRILVRDFGCDITEVDNGLDALDQLSEKQFGFMLLDPELPVIDGFQVLEAVRRAPEHESLPVLIMTRQRDEAAVRKLAELGISDYLIKPLEATLAGARLARLIAATGKSNGGRGHSENGESTLRPDATVMVVDGSADFRNLFADTLGGKAIVVPVNSGVQALKKCHQAAPEAVFIGEELGMLHRDLLVAELRRIPAMFDSLLIGVVAEEDLETARRNTSWNGAVLRTYVPEAFLEQAGGFFGSSEPTSTMLQAYPALEENLHSAVEQVSGMMLKTHLVVRPATTQDRMGPQRIAAVTITRDEDGLTLKLEVRCALDSARQIAATVLGVKPDRAKEEDVLSTLAELANIIAGRLQHGLSEHGITVSCGLPMARAEDGAPRSKAGDDAIELLVASEKAGIAIEVILS